MRLCKDLVGHTCMAPGMFLIIILSPGSDAPGLWAAGSFQNCLPLSIMDENASHLLSVSGGSHVPHAEVRSSHCGDASSLPHLPTPHGHSGPSIFPQYSLGSFGLPWCSKESACNAGDLGSIPGLGRSPGEGNGYPLQYSGEFHGQRSLVDYSPRGRKESDTTFTIHYSQLMTFSFTHRATSGQLKAFHPPQFKVRGAQTQRWDFSHLLWGLLPKPGAPEDAKDAPCENQPASLEGFIFSPTTNTNK